MALVNYEIMAIVNLFRYDYLQIVNGWESNKSWLPKDRITEVVESYLTELKLFMVLKTVVDFYIGGLMPKCGIFLCVF